MQRHFAGLGLQVFCPSLAVPSFENLSPLAACELLANELSVESRQPLVVIASSFGAFLALHALQRAPREAAPPVLVLLAPVTDPWRGEHTLLTPKVEAQWRGQGSLPLTDLAKQQEVRVHYRFVEELYALGACREIEHVPTLIVHGRSDEVVSVEQSREYTAKCAGVTLVTVDDDHGLLAQPAELVELIERFVSSKTVEVSKDKGVVE